MEDMIDDVLAIIVLVTPIVLMIFGFRTMGLHYEFHNFIAGLALEIIGMLGTMGSTEYFVGIVEDDFCK